ncbi:lipopolysaccharide assembly protein LapB [Terribacillus sp. 7520-G]|uniref:tetratricopeptide repeat protein n=1 Tax=Terribacillus sp. 7520-G TaxID=2025389 RepID=UPI000BA63CF8|nr:hypothetical protein [Terribacillus sp. 7520-G]PAD40152.1 hypothetical protein CHH53_03810 [Terribacillus sp. 7520-G]
MIAYAKNSYSEALDSFEKAESYLEKISDPIEIGEFHLRKAMTYFYLDVIALSVLHTEKAMQAFKPHSPFVLLLARSEMLQGLNYQELLDFDLAEEYLHRALTHSKKAEANDLATYINHNLGALYVKRDLPGTAIRYLEEALKDKPEGIINLQGLYLLADCFWKTNIPSKALEAYNEGFHRSLKEDNISMKWEFAMLHKKYEDRLNFESVWKEGIDYFIQIKDNYNVRHYAKELAEYYTSIDKYELANRYYSLAIKKT